MQRSCPEASLYDRDLADEVALFRARLRTSRVWRFSQRTRVLGLGEYFTNPVASTAVIDRIVHHAHGLRIRR